MRRTHLVTAFVLLTATAGCHHWRGSSLSEPVEVRVTSADSAHAVRFALDVEGGPADLRSSRMHGVATDAKLVATTPSAILLRPGTKAASLRVLGSGSLEVIAKASSARLGASGQVVQLASTRHGLEIRGN
jgi:hypothetical protein